jgi:hypothetical protein
MQQNNAICVFQMRLLGNGIRTSCDWGMSMGIAIYLSSP